MSGRNKSKVKIHMSKPELPPFLQRIREQMVDKEAAERKEQSDKKRKERPIRDEDPEDEPTVVRLNDDNISEEEYKKFKKDEKLELIKSTSIMKAPDFTSLISKRSDKETVSKKKLIYVSSSSDEDD